MLPISEELKESYLKSSISKVLHVDFPALDMHLVNNSITDSSVSIEERLCSENDIVFGGCEAAMAKFRIQGDVDLSGYEFIMNQVVDGKYNMPLGTYQVCSSKRTDDMQYREIIAYDAIYYKLAVDVTEWYKSLALPMTLKAFRQSLFAYVGIEIEVQDLINDDMIVERTIEPAVLNGRDVAKRIGEINGVFGHMTRDNKFKYITLGNFGLYPSETLYPDEDLYPSESDVTLGTAGYKRTYYEDYEVVGIDCLQVRQEDGDVGHVVYDTRNYENPYIVTGNFLLYGKTAQQLETIARRLFDKIKGITYRPHNTSMVGLPYLEVGDSIAIVKGTDVIESFIMQRMLSGIQSLSDEVSASGDQYRNNSVSANEEIEMLKGKSLMIKKSVEGLQIQVTDLEADTKALIEVTASSIRTEISNLDNTLSSQIEQTASSISTRITNEVSGLNSSISQTADSINTRITNEVLGLSSSISQTASSITSRVNGLDNKYSELKQTVDGFDLTGYLTVTDLGSGGSTVINGNRIQTGTLQSVSAIFASQNAVFCTFGGSSLTGDDYQWRIDSNAIYSAYKTIELGRNGNIACSGDIYIKSSWYDNWSVTDCFQDLYNRVRALESR